MEKIQETEQLNMLDDSYRFCLDNFEGPLDLLLHLIKDSKLDIMDVKLSEVTEQYLLYMKDIGSIDMEKASDFITVAATLIEIKSKGLLPRDDAPVSEEEDSEALLLQRLKEYKMFKEAGEDLKRIEDVDKLYKEPDKQADKVRIVLKDMVLDSLLDAFAGLLARSEVKAKEEEPKKIVKDRFTVAEKIVQIRDIVTERKAIKFSELFAEDHTKSEMLNIFLALLELLKLGTIKAKQSDIFGEIDIRYEGEANG